MRNLLLVSILALSTGLAGCQTTGPKQATGTVAGALAGGLLGSQVGQGEGRVVATAVGAVLGGLIGSEVGRSLDELDQQRLYAAQYQALETGRSGSSVQWSNPDSGHYGHVVPGPAYEVNRLNCRDYTHTIYIDGSAQTARGTACRQPDGTWKTVS